MLRSVFTKTLAGQRWAVAAWGGGLGLLAVITAIGWAIAYPTAADRALLATQLRTGLSAVEVLYGEPIHVERVGGFVEWRTLNLTPLLFGTYAILMVTGLTRGAEESGTVDLVFTSPVSRFRVLLEQMGAAATAIFVCGVLLAAGLLLAVPLAGEGALAAGDATAAALNVTLPAALFGAFAFVTSQLAQRRRNAALIAVVAMVAAHFANTLGLVVPALGWLRFISPLYLTSRSSPMADGSVDWLAMACVAFLTLGIGAAGLALALRRDVAAAFPVPRLLPKAPVHRVPGNGRLLRNPFTRALRDGLGAALAWGLGLAALSGMLTALVPNVRQALLEMSGDLSSRLQQAGLLSEPGTVELLVFSFLPIFVALYALTLAAGWAHDETDDRLGFELAAPLPRQRLYADRYAAGVIATAAVIVVTGAAIVLTAALRGIELPSGRLAAALLGLALLGAAVIGAGFAISAWRPDHTAALTGALVAVSYFFSALIPLLGLPGWVANISVFGLLGQPLVNGVSYWRLLALALIAVVLAAAGAIRFQRRDILH